MINWHKRKRISELIKTYIIYILLIGLTGSLTLNYLFVKEPLITTTKEIVKDVQIKYVEKEVPYFFDNEGNQWEWCTITGYTQYDDGCNNIVATGFDLDLERVKKLRICASNYYPKYTILEIEGLGPYIVLDTGLGYKTEDGWEDDHWVDIMISIDPKDKQLAYAFGKQQRRVRIIN